MARYGTADLLTYVDGFYMVKVEGLWYGLRFGRDIREVPINYTLKYTGRGKPMIEYVKADLKIKKVNIPEEVLRSVVLTYVKRTLKSYGFL